MKTLIANNKNYFIRKYSSGEKRYIPFVQVNGFRRVLRKNKRRGFKKASEAVNYLYKVVARYNRIIELCKETVT